MPHKSRLIRRALSGPLRAAARGFPVVSVTGPRQSGKTTLVRTQFSRHAYVSLELPDQRAFALEDPRGFLAQFDGPVILDEVQRAPDLLSYIQTRVDETGRPGQFVLTGSQNFLLLQGVSQTLAGRCAVLHLLPFSLAELEGRRDFDPSELGTRVPSSSRKRTDDPLEVMFKGFYPPIHDRKLPPRDWLGSYCQTYLERDVRQIINVGDLEAFGRFLRLCAGRNGQILNLSSLASDCGITHTTASRWISVLEASFLILMLRPHFRNFGKRLIKSPKLYFLDTGLLCFLLNIRSWEELHQHSSRGAIFESFVVSELHKGQIHRGEVPSLYFWRDSAGHEIDLLVDLGERQIPVEVKASRTLVTDQFEPLAYWLQLAGTPSAPAALVYAGTDAARRSGICVYPWHFI